jgi:hypothetical protein
MSLLTPRSLIVWALSFKNPKKRGSMYLVKTSRFSNINSITSQSYLILKSQINESLITSFSDSPLLVFNQSLHVRRKRVHQFTSQNINEFDKGFDAALNLSDIEMIYYLILTSGSLSSINSRRYGKSFDKETSFPTKGTTVAITSQIAAIGQR